MPGERKARTDGMKSWSDLSKQKVFKKDEPIMMYENWWTASKVQMESGLKLARERKNLPIGTGVCSRMKSLWIERRSKQINQYERMINEGEIW